MWCFCVVFFLFFLQQLCPEQSNVEVDALATDWKAQVNMAAPTSELAGEGRMGLERREGSETEGRELG